jgi:hypothetical protein
MIKLLLASPLMPLMFVFVCTYVVPMSLLVTLVFRVCVPICGLFWADDLIATRIPSDAFDLCVSVYTCGPFGQMIKLLLASLLMPLVFCACGVRIVVHEKNVIVLA